MGEPTQGAAPEGAAPSLAVTINDPHGLLASDPPSAFDEVMSQVQVVVRDKARDEAAAHVFAKMWRVHQEVRLSFMPTLVAPSWVMHPQTGYELLKSHIDIAGQHPVQPTLDGGWSAFGWPIVRDTSYAVGQIDLIWNVQAPPQDGAPDASHL